MKEQLNEFGGFVVGVVRSRQHQHRVGGQSLRNPFDIPRRNLLDQVVRMRANFLQPAFKHSKLLDEGKCVYFMSFVFIDSPQENLVE